MSVTNFIRKNQFINNDFYEAIFLLFIGASIASTFLLYRYKKDTQNLRNLIDEYYSSLPQSEIVRPYDLNNNDSLDQSELENLMRDYKLVKNSPNSP